MTPKIYVVDRANQLLGVKARSELLPHEIYRVTGLWVLNERGDILLAKRSQNKKHDPGTWGTSVSGTIEEGESYESNIVKEAFEELGLKDLILEVGPLVFIDDGHRFFCQWFYTVVPADTDFVLQVEEVEEVTWISRTELLEMVSTTPDLFIKSMSKAVQSLPH